MSASTLSPADVHALREITATHIRTSLAADWKGWTDTCTDDVVLAPPGQEHVHGRTNAREWLQSFPEVVEFSGEPTVVRGRGDMAFTAGTAKMRLRIDGELSNQAFKWLAVFERQPDGQWKMMANAWNEQPH